MTTESNSVIETKPLDSLSVRKLRTFHKIRYALKQFLYVPDRSLKNKIISEILRS